MQIVLTERFQHDFDRLPSTDQAQVIRVVERLSAAMGTPHRHAGLGIRKLHRSGIYEARMGLNVRVVFLQAKQQLILHRVGHHESVRRYLRQL